MTSRSKTTFSGRDCRRGHHIPSARPTIFPRGLDGSGWAVQTALASLRSERRILAVCSVKGRDAGAYLVAKGLAVAYVKYSKIYVPQQTEARKARLGLWAGPFEMPWDWRKAH